MGKTKKNNGCVQNSRFNELNKKFILIIKPWIMHDNYKKNTKHNNIELRNAVSSIFVQVLDQIKEEKLLDNDSADDIKFLLDDYLQKDDYTCRYCWDYLTDTGNELYDEF